MKWILILSVLFTKCKETVNIQQDKTRILTELNGLYDIEIFDGREVSKYNLTISFNQETNQVSGFSGCNRYFGSYSLEGDILKFEPLASTRMMCRGESQKLETNLLKTLSKVNKVKVGENYLQFFEDAILLFKADKEVVNKSP